MSSWISIVTGDTAEQVLVITGRSLVAVRVVQVLRVVIGVRGRNKDV